ncbi:hypothetical protein [Bradyrhizobium elkanii]|uniref:hypothetical protein n=1 Tax=Bradyrhizobium elkanii TaxID=29448 RepID=UPI00056FAB6D|nr:hypothetical protein [Bradyrhizobium elkanii]
MITAEAIAKPEITRIATLRSKLNQFFLEPGLARNALKHDPEKREADFRRDKRGSRLREDQALTTR